MEEQILVHHGIKGQKWGIRTADGSREDYNTYLRNILNYHDLHD